MPALSMHQDTSLWKISCPVLSMASTDWNNSLWMSHIFQFICIGRTLCFACCSHVVMKTKEQEVNINRFVLKVLSWFEQRFGPKQEKPTPIKEAHQVFLVHAQFPHPGKKKKKKDRKFPSLFSTCCSISYFFWCINEVGNLHLKKYWRVMHMWIGMLKSRSLLQYFTGRDNPWQWLFSFKVWLISKYSRGLTLLYEKCNLVLGSAFVLIFLPWLYVPIPVTTQLISELTGEVAFLLYETEATCTALVSIK